MFKKFLEWAKSEPDVVKYGRNPKPKNLKAPPPPPAPPLPPPIRVIISLKEN